MRPALLLALAATAPAQVTQFTGPSPNLTTVLDFDTPFVPSGPISPTSTVFTGVGLTSVSLFGTGFIAVGDTLTSTSNVSGQGLVAQGGVLTVAGPGEALDDIDSVSGFDVVLATPVDEFQVKFIDQVDMDYAIELFAGGTSLGMETFRYPGPFPRPPHYWRGPQPFDRVVITFPNQFTIGVGIDEFAFGNGPAPPMTPAECVETTYGSNNGGLVGGTVFFDVTATTPVDVFGLQTNFDAPAGAAVGLEVWTTAGTFAGNETNAGAWALTATDDGTAVSAGSGLPTDIAFAAPLSLPAGTTGLALVAINSAHDYTNGTGTNQQYTSADGVLTVDGGSACNGSFAAPIFSPRVWNGRLCHGSPPICACLCTPAELNSTGAPGAISATGSPSVAANDLVLHADSLPASSFGFFLTSRTAGFVANPAGSAGNLCLGGAIGRFVGPGQIQNSGAAGSFSLAIDSGQQPTPTGLVQVAAGEVWYFQAWYRDVAPGGTATSNFTDGLEVTFSG